MRTFVCACGAKLFFDNSQCLSCGREVGWCPVCESISPLDALAGNGYRCARYDCGASLLKCRNYADYAVCNRMVPVDEQGSAPALCDCCRYNAVIPDLSIPGHQVRWAQLEAAKRRLFYVLDLLGLPHGTAVEGFDPPLAFSFMTDALPDNGLWHGVAGERKVYTGHADGQITINIKEADSVERERLRVDLSESHRTLIGHFRHEIGHYYWQLLVRNRDEAACREVFGDHWSLDYDAAVEQYYRAGPPDGWSSSFVSAYATMHPWEDFAETFALYLDVRSVVDTAEHAGLLRNPGGDLSALLRDFLDVGMVVNELNREMGLEDLTVKSFTPTIERKLGYIHDLLTRSRSVEAV